MIYPSIYKYNAPYRGPRDPKEINKALTSIGHDIETVNAAAEKQREMIYENIKNAVGMGDRAHMKDMQQVAEVSGDKETLKGLEQMATSLRNMDKVLDMYLGHL